MTDRPILFSGPMVRALLAGTKTQTRRVITPANTLFNGSPWSKLAKAQKWDWATAFVDPGPSPAGNPGPYLKLSWLSGDAVPFEDTTHRIYPRVQPGDRLWVREQFAICPTTAWALPKAVSEDPDMAAYYRVDFDRSGRPRWKPSIHMPRWASRITLTVSDVWVERLQDITEEDAVAEGCPGRLGPNPDFPDEWAPSPVEEYRDLWNTINGPGSWAANPWVAAYTFEVEHNAMPPIGG